LSELPSVTVAICTKDRPSDLRRCLASCVSIRDQVLEIVVVDNASSTDETRRVAEAAGVRYLREDTPGLSAARNCAIASARGEVIAFTDDDCEATPEWIPALLEPYRDRAVGGVTGRTVLPQSAQRAQQIIGRQSGGSRGMKGFRIHPGDADRVFNRAIAGIGANMSFRREVLQATGGFPLELRSSGDDVYMFNAVLRAGASLVYAPDAVVAHHHRETIARHARRTFRYGRDAAVVYAWLAIERSNAALFAFNVAREVVVRVRNIAASLITVSFARALFNATALGGMVTGALAMPSRWRGIARAVRKRQADINSARLCPTRPAVRSQL
jgi:GT2 family glycosyltransferase